MPYFHRKPIKTLTDVLPAGTPIPGLPSRVMPALGQTLGSMHTAAEPAKPVADIVQQATSVLDKVRQRNLAQLPASAQNEIGSFVRSPYQPIAPPTSYANTSAQAGELQGRLNALVEQIVSIIGSPRAEPTTDAGDRANDDDVNAVDPAPVVGSCMPVMAGTATQILIALCNEDATPACLSFLSTGLVGESGATISAANISFQPSRLDLQPGAHAELFVIVQVPSQTHPGVYSGLIRASQLDYLHAVLVIEVK